MTTQLHDDTMALSPKTHTIRLRFDETPEDQTLYTALSESSHRECRTPLPLQIKHLLAMAMGLKRPNALLLKRIGIDYYDLEARCTKLEEKIRESYANAAADNLPPPPTRPITTLRLIPGGAAIGKPEDNRDGLVP